MDEGGGWKNEIWTGPCVERQIKVQFRGVGAHPWLLEGRNGLVRGISQRLCGDDWFLNTKTPFEAQRRLSAV